jgi:urease accessory protein
MDPLALLRMAQLADSAFPSGGFAFSGGLETWLAEGAVSDAGGVEGFVREQVLPRWTGIDRWFLREARAAAAAPDAAEALCALDALCEAHALTEPLAEASRRMGRAMLTSAARIGIGPATEHGARVRAGRAPGHLPVAQGIVAAALDVPAAAAEAGALHGALMGTLSAAVRLGRIGALGAQEILLRLGPIAAAELAAPPPAAPAAFCPLAEIAAARRGRLVMPLFAA